MPRFLPRALSRQRRAPRPGTAEHRPVKLLHIGVAMALTLVAAGALASLLLGGALTWLGLPETTGKKYDLKTLLDIIKISLAVVGGIGGAIALVVAYRKQRLAEEENHRAREENERARQAARREDTKLYAERFDKAGDKLGAESAAVQLAGVHALAALADDWDGGRQMCIDVLCAYLRMPPELEPDAKHDPNAHGTWLAMREVRTTIIRLIATHLRADASTPWHGADLDFTGVGFGEDGDTEGADFTNAVFSGGTVSFASTGFSGAVVTFDGAEFSDGTVSFDGAEFTGGAVRFIGAKFSGSRVTFDGAEFTGGEVDFTGVTNWSRPPDGLPASAPGLKLPPKLTPPAAPESAD